MNNLQQKTITGSFWSLFERFGYLGIQFISNLVLARLLMPSDFGTVGVLIVFTTLSEVLISSGLGAALIQKKEITDIDISTVFYTNMALSIIIYIFIFFSAPFVAIYFKNPNLTSLLRVIELMVVLDAFAIIQNTLLIKSMNFKRITLIRIVSIIIAVIISIVCALYGLGVWSLVIQYLIYSTLRAVLLWFMSKWKPLWDYSIDSFKTLFSYGSRLLMSSFVAELYNNFQAVLIGHNFSAKDLGYYTQGRQLMQIPVDSLARVVNNVSFPAYAIIQNERKQLQAMVRQNLLILVFLNTPLMFYLSTSAKPLLVFLYSEKWLESVPYFQFLCLGFGLLSIIHNSSLTALKSVGRSDYVLKLEIIKKFLGVFLLLSGMYFWGIWGLMYGLAINSFIELFLNGYYLKKEINYGALDQIRDFLPYLLLSVMASIVTFMFMRYVPIVYDFLNLITTFIIFSSIYLTGAFTLRLEAFYLAKKVVTNLIQKRSKFKI